MARVRRVLAVLLLAALAVPCLVLVGYDIYDFFVVGHGIEHYEYYSSRPFMLLVPVGVACLAGLAIWFFHRLPAKRRRRIVLLGWAAANVTGMALVGCWTYMVWEFFQFESSPEGRLAAEYGGMSHSKWLFAGIAALAAVFLVVSWCWLVRFTRKPGPGRPRGCPV